MGNKCFKILIFTVFITFIVLFGFINDRTAFASMRNLLSEFRVAALSGNLDKIDALIKEGLSVNDTTDITYDIALVHSAGIKEVGTAYDSMKVSEDFAIALIKRLAKAKADFKDIFSRSLESRLLYLTLTVTSLKTNVLKAFLDAGADPDKYPKYHDSHGMNHTLLFERLGDNKRFNDGRNYEQIKMLVEYKASLTEGIIIGFRTHAMDYFLRHRGLEYTEETLKYISDVLTVLRNAGAGKSDAKKYLETLRERHRNVPDALKYLTEVEKAIDGSWLCSTSNWGISSFCIMILMYYFNSGFRRKQ